MIKFHCANCDKKIGVPEQYAGRAVRCPQCQQPAQVPVLEPEPEVELIPIQETTYQDPQDQQPANDNIWTDDLLQPTAPSTNNSYNNYSDDQTADGQSFDPVAPSNHRPLSEPEETPFEKLKINFGVPLALAAGFGAAILCGMLWAMIVKATDWEFGWMAIILGALVGLTMRICTFNRNTIIGVLAALFAVMGILSGKFFIAKWYIMPMLEQEIYTNIVEDDDMMFGIACSHLANKGEFTQQFADQLRDYHYHDFFAQPNYRPNQQNLTPEEEFQLQEAEAYVIELVDSWPDDEREQIVRQTASENLGEAGGFLKNLGMVFCFIAAFSFYDILWILLAIYNSYKAATYE